MDTGIAFAAVTHAQRRHQGHRQDRLLRPSDDRAFQIRRGAHQAHAEDHHPGAVGALRPPGRHADRQDGLSEARQDVRRSRPGLQKGRARFRRCRLPLSAARRSVHRHAVRSEISPADEGPRRRSAMRSARSTASSSTIAMSDIPVGHDGDHASVPRQLQIDLHGHRRLRGRCRKCCSTRSRCTAISWNTTPTAPAVSSRSSACRKAASRCSAW